MTSALDGSVNFVDGDVECRYVRRTADKVTAYLSSQTGCNRGCKMCHLTATGQTKAKDLTREELLRQLSTVLEYYWHQPGEKANRVNIAFMARGEPLASSIGDGVLCNLMELAYEGYALVPRVCLSTILSQVDNLTKRFPLSKPLLYYSLYSTDPGFRKKWLPAAIDVETAFGILKKYQVYNQQIITLHYALIENENDSYLDAKAVAELVQRHELVTRFNLVRYNSPDPMYHESPYYSQYASWLQAYLPQTRVKIIERVGYDVKASCGMFV